MKWKTEKRKVSELKPFPGNPRQANEKEVRDLDKSLEKFNVADPLIINTDNTVIGGNFRLSRLNEKGVKEVDVRVPDKKLTRKEAEELNLRLNKNQGEWDKDLLANFDEALLKGVGWDSEELDQIFDLGLEEDDFNVEEEYEKIKEPKAKYGDIYQLGKHRLMCGDATKREDVEKLMNGEKADMVFTDPPYGLGGYAGRSGKFEKMKGDDEDVRKFYNCIPKTRERYVCGNYKVLRFLEERPRDVIIWVKNNIGMGKGYRGQYEMIFYYGNFKGSDSDVWIIDKAVNYQHPTQKPVALVERAIKNSSKRNGIVLDLFGGSGSTLIAAEQLNRKCYMMELDPKYVDVIIARWEKFTNKKAKKL